ncbi:MFS transporter [Confluentibacter flavum]|uniref:MFS transporter n=1 Tax=Confluentibacter flavum TaxID=1909700 RepID=A0A2N3HKY9_9FLAO|nr:MFS transporter [Confluentibacter flavum]PKQ45593.1 MFS transporter [Confluentibacter flavum]
MDNQTNSAPDRLLFLTCFIAIVTTAFGFILRAIVLPEWGVQFNLTQTQLGEISGVGLWPFAISIVLFSLVVDKIGYKTSLGFAFICHVTSVILTVTADGYSTLYLATFIGAIGNGVVEAVANPVVATMFSKDKTKWLNMLHAGWPGGLVLGGIIALLMGTDVPWEYKIALTLIPTLVYGIMMLRRKFPLNERVQAGVSYKEMLQEVGAVGALVIVAIIVFQLGEVFGWAIWLNVAVIMLITLLFGLYTKSFGQPLFVILLVIMIPLAVTELGTDSWITDLMTPAMTQIGLQAGWILVYTSAIMFVLRLFAGSIIHRVSPLGLLAICSLVAAVGLFFLSYSVGVMILVAATIYGFGKAFFWPTMLGVVAERFPKGGALTLNIIGGLGMIAAGVIGAGVIGFVQDSSIEKGIRDYDMKQNTELSQNYITEEKTSIFGDYRALDQIKFENASETEVATIIEIQHESKKEALRYIVIFPILMFISYMALIFYFRSKGGYAAVALTKQTD